jgi:CheY-like chemotaxis protein
MGGCTGVEVLKKVKKLKKLPHHGAITLSAHAIAAVREECKKAGFVGYLTKPFNAKSLNEVIQNSILKN